MTSLLQLKDQIEELNNYHQSKLLDIFEKYDTPVSENNNGTFINLSLVEKKCIAEIEELLKYIKTQEKELKTREQLKEDYKNKYFKDNNDNKDNKDSAENYCNE